MKVQIENDYSVLTTKIEQRTYRDSLETILDYFKENIDGETFSSESNLLECFTDYVRDSFELPDLKHDEEFEDYSIDLRILNWNEIFPELTYLIVPEEEKSCCSSFSQYYGYKYCPTCGERL